MIADRRRGRRHARPHVFTGWLGEQRGRARRGGCSAPPASRPTRRPEAAVRGVHAPASRYRRNQETADGDAASSARAVRARRDAVRTVIAEALGRGPGLAHRDRGQGGARRLRHPGLPTRAMAETAEEAAAPPRRSASRWRSRSCSPDIIHKSDIGGVVLDLADAGERARGGRAHAGTRPGRAARRADRGLRRAADGPTRPSAHELIVGIERGPAVRAGRAVRPGRHRGRGGARSARSPCRR